MEPPTWVLAGGRLRRGREVAVAPWSPAVRWGAGLFETVGCDGGRPLLWEAHAARLDAGLRSLGWRGGRVPSGRQLERLLESAGVGGPAALRVVAVLASRHVSVVAWACGYRPPRRARRLGIAVEPVAVPAGPLAGLKSCAYLPCRWARDAARRAGAAAALLLDADGAVREGDAANLFVAAGGAVATPPAPRRCLPGVLRAWCRDALAAAGIAVVERDVALDEVLAADEVWLTSSLAGAVPVRAVGGAELPVPRLLVGRLERAGIPAPGYRAP